MKKIILLFVALLQFATSHSQTINYQKTFQDAKAIAAKQNKPIFVLLSAPPLPSGIVIPTSRPQFISGLDTKEVVELYNKKFVGFRAVVTDTTIKELRGLLHPVDFPAYIFLDNKANLVYKNAGNTPMAKKYLDIANEALKRITSGQTISNYEDLDKKGTIEAAQLKAYIKMNQEMGISDNSRLINEYVDMLSIKSLSDYDELLFILKASPYVTSKAYKLAHTDQKVFDSIYKREPLALRKEINTRITNNSMIEAIKTKNTAMAMGAASFSAGTWGKDYRAANKASVSDMLWYYKAVKDTANYFRQAIYYYDSYYMNISADSAKKLDQASFDRLKASTMDRQKAELKIIDTHKNDGKMPSPVVFTTFGSAPNQVATVLNNVAYDFYAMGSHNQAQLFKALTWSKRAIELQPNSSYYDTIAHIMYRLALYDEAELNQQKAIDLAAKEQHASPTHLSKLSAEFMKMKERTL